MIAGQSGFLKIAFHLETLSLLVSVVQVHPRVAAPAPYSALRPPWPMGSLPFIRYLGSSN